MAMRTRKLRLSKETLSVLDAGELRSVVGGSDLRCIYDCRYTYCPECVNDYTLEFCPTPTLPVEECI